MLETFKPDRCIHLSDSEWMLVTFRSDRCIHLSDSEWMFVTFRSDRCIHLVDSEWVLDTFSPDRFISGRWISAGPTSKLLVQPQTCISVGPTSNQCSTNVWDLPDKCLSGQCVMAGEPVDASG